MEDNKIRCPIHPKEHIQRVALDPHVDQELFCIDCLLSYEKPTAVSSQYITLEEFLEIGAKFYQKEKMKKITKVPLPPEIKNVLEWEP